MLENILTNFHSNVVNMNPNLVTILEKTYPYSNSYFSSSNFVELFIKIVGEIVFSNLVLFILNEKMYIDFYSFFFDTPSCLKLIIFIVVAIIYAINGPFITNKIKNYNGSESESTQKNDEFKKVNNSNEIRENTSSKNKENKQSSESICKNDNSMQVNQTEEGKFKRFYYLFITRYFLYSFIKSIANFSYLVRKDGFSVLKINQTINYLVIIVSSIYNKNENIDVNSSDIDYIQFIFKLFLLLTFNSIFTNFNKFYNSVLDLLYDRNYIQNLFAWSKIYFKSILIVGFYIIFYIPQYSVFAFYNIEDYLEISKLRDVCFIFSLISINSLIP